MRISTRTRGGRAGFTLVELLVAAALSILIMAVLSTAFQTGLQTLSTLKSLGDMAERLKTAETLLRTDLTAEHFATSGNATGTPGDGSPGPLRVSDLRFDLPAPLTSNLPTNGYFQIYQFGGSLDELADAFLSEPSYRTQQLGLSPLLRPPSLPRQEGVARLRTLVERRAWGDVLKISTGMLNSPKGPHSDVYASLVTLPLNAPQVDTSSIPMEARLETVEIMTLQCHAWLKLRRYADLAAEVERWNFVTHNDAAAQSPDWLPWGLRKYMKTQYEDNLTLCIYL